ncbi:MAG TPA: ABC transporter permease [Polyangiales bacterium]|nr:ABC transporter permease [Polyangiales bacterium]
MQLAPGDMVDAMMGEAGGATPEYMAELRLKFGLDQPLHLRLAHYLTSLATLDLGYSHRLQAPVLALIMTRVPSTLLLMSAAIAIALPVGTLLGAAQSRRPGSALDTAISVFVLSTHALPAFWLGLMAIVFLAADRGWFPTGGLASFDAPAEGRMLDVLHHLVLPAVTLANLYVAVYARLIRTSLLELKGADFVRTARAKGLSPERVFWVHTVRNALLPVVTMLGMQIASMLSGAVIVESVFGWPGLGRLAYEAVFARDTNLLLGILFLGSILVTLVNFGVDVLYGVIDPRVAA